MNNNYIIAITEGVKTEKQIIENIESLYFQESGMNFKILPFKTNIYELWKTLKADDFETDIVELLKEKELDANERLKDVEVQSISEVYLFFDYDGHAAANSKIPSNEVENVIEEMLNVFSNETENGKMYISYPMVEAIKDLKREDSCDRQCRVKAKKNIGYKSNVHSITEFQDLTHLTKEDWIIIITHNFKKVNCLIDNIYNCKDRSSYKFPDYKSYREKTNQKNIFDKQKTIIMQEDNVLVLSGFPFFLVDYFGIDFYFNIDSLFL